MPALLVQYHEALFIFLDIKVQVPTSLEVLYFYSIYIFVLKIKSFPNVFHAKDAEYKNAILLISVRAFGTESIKKDLRIQRVLCGTI